MTEEEWLTCKEPYSLYEFLRKHQKVSHTKRGRRRMRLFACNCCRRIWPAVADERSRRAVEISEQYADGEVSRSELYTAHEAAKVAEAEIATASYSSTEPPPERWGATAAMRAASCEQIASWATGAANMAVPAARSIHAVPDGERSPETVNQCHILRDIFGNPFRPVTFARVWRTDTAVSLARQMYDSQDFSAMPILADALQDAGCDNDDILTHCRATQLPHVRGCWVVDLVLGKT